MYPAPEWLSSPNTRWVLAGCVLLGFSSGVLGSFALLRRRSLMGDTLAHAALPGVCVAFLLTGKRSLPLFLLGALAAGLIGATCIQAIHRFSRIKEDTALAIVLSVFFAVGMVLLTLIQRSGSASQAGLDRFLFGQAASMVGNDVRILALSASVVGTAALLLFKEFKLLCFDPDFAQGIGFSVMLLDGLLLLLLVVAVVVGLQAVGAILMAALLITPAAGARFWTDRLDVMVVVSGFFGALSGGLGTLASAGAEGAPTGPMIVLAATGCFALSMLAAPRRGLVGRLLRYRSLRSRVAREHTLRALYELCEPGEQWQMVVPLERLVRHRRDEPGVRSGLRALRRDGLVEETAGGVRLTASGLQSAYEIVRNHRLWEMFLMHEGQLGADHVDRDADWIEHILPQDVVEELERLLRLHGRAPALPHSVHALDAGAG